ncbi:hypothetical protein GH714_029486 [Hevea brasiliensis]|uniref:Homeobox domain-containing protein n=1 Tax=Hevea brasiliensis TaxID=3981 RepID=A0A6A6K7I9_HEVBR|nr:hypothetical protein GH714_029486 [Hevea brasiliensis]
MAGEERLWLAGLGWAGYEESSLIESRTAVKLIEAEEGKMEMKRKSPLQLEALEKFYAEQKYPTHTAMEELAAVLDLTFKQVQGIQAGKLTCQDYNGGASVKKHGIGKGLMTVWRATNPNGGDFPTGIPCVDREIIPQISTPVSRKPLGQQKKRRQLVSIMKQRRLENKSQQKRKFSTKRKVESKRDESQNQPRKEKCELALEGVLSQERVDQLTLLLDDEELELRELQAGLNPVTCSDHCANNGLHGCSLCKGVFDLISSGMLQRVCVQFIVFHFLYTYSVSIDICPFTLDEFAQAFHDKVEHQEFVVEFWKKSLNPLTWTEILHQVLVAAGFGSRQGSFHREALSKRGNNGLKVSDLAKSMEITELNLAKTTEELELLISSTLSSDITLFEKISPSAYRLRISTLSKEANDFQSDTEDSGSVHDDFNDSGTCSSSDSECDSDNSNSRKSKHTNHHRSKKNMLTVYNEIDESHPGEVWLLGLIEGEYSDLSIEEKLNVLVALIDLDVKRTTVESVPNMHHYGSGAKIKRSSSKQHNFPRPSWVHVGQVNNSKEPYSSSASHPIDSSVSILKFNEGEKSSGKGKDMKETELGVNLHPMQSIFLGSDRRYSRYWLFLGPCNSRDPGHKRVYFESSEDGHWEVIDTEEVSLNGICSIF